MAQALRAPRLRGRPVTDQRRITRADLHIHPRHFRGRHHAATITVVVLLAVVAFQLFPQRDVTVLSNGQAYRVAATFDPRAEGLAAASVALQPGDRILYGTGGRHTSVAVQRARPVRIEVDGATVEVRTQASSVGGALAAAGVNLQTADRVYLDGQPVTLREPLLAAPATTSATNPGVAGDPAADGVRLAIVRARPVTVFVDTLRLDLSSAAPDVDSLVSEMGMTIREGDLVRPPLSTPLTSGMTVRLAKARTISVKLDGTDLSLYTQAYTVGEVLRLLGVDPGPSEVLSHPRDSIIVNGMTLVIGLTRVVEEAVDEPVPPPTLQEVDASLAPGSVRVVPGTAGVRTTKFRVTYKNGVEDSRVAISTALTRSPVPSRQISGSKPATVQRPTLDAPDYTGAYSRKLTVWATWYNATHGGKTREDPAFGITASGRRLEYGICAVDPSVIPIGTWMYIPKYGKCLAADVGGGIRGNMVDLGFPESAGEHPWATQFLEIYILD